MRLFNSFKSVAAATCVAAIASTAAYAQEMTLKLGHLANEQNAGTLPQSNLAKS